MKFLQQIACEFVKREGDSLFEFCFVFPNRRAGVFFRDALSKVAEKPLFSPKIATIEELFSSLSELQKIESPDTLFRLFKSYTKVSGGGESFDDFYFWGEMLLGDFDETDKYLVDAQRLFANIRDLKQLESDYSFLSPQQLEAVRSFWNNFFPAEGSESKKRFKAAWEVLYPLYNDFREELRKEGLAYEGMIFREVADSLASGGDQSKKIKEHLTQYKKYVFVGFNALTPCEKALMSELQKMGITDFYWDYSNNFVSDLQNRASAFVAENILKFPSSIKIEAENIGLPEFELTAVPSAVGQARVAGEIVSIEGGGIDTAVILPDPDLLVPVLNSIPQSVESVNVTMGYPLKSASVVSLAESLVELQKGVTYFRRVLPVLRHNYIRNISGDSAKTLISEITQRNLIYVPKEEFSRDSLLSAIFTKAENYSEYLITVLELINSSGTLSPMEREFNFALLSLLEKIKGFDSLMSAATFGRVLKKLISSTSVPFTGEPLSGLQIMGVLESRALDFENVIICSMNEGVFPKSPSRNSFIPLSLRRGFGLPSFEYWDALSAYTFYRLLTGAKKVFLLYDSRSEGLRSGEVSRFIRQLKYHYGVDLKERTIRFNIPRTEKKSVEVPKNDEVLKALRDYIFSPNGKLSASALNCYIDCPLSFWLRYVKSLSEEEEVKEGVEADSFGKIFHKAAELVYEPFKGKIVTAQALYSIIKNEEFLNNITTNAFMDVLGLTEIKGRNFIVLRLINKYLLNVLQYDAKRTPFTYLDSEKRAGKDLVLNNGESVIIKGFLDRIDTCGAPLRIVDYKSGGAKPEKNKPMEMLFEKGRDKKFQSLFQMYLYAMIMDKDEIKISLYYLRSLLSEGEVDIVVNREELETFILLLKSLVEEILNPEIPFFNVPEEKKCIWCPFNNICG